MIVVVMVVFGNGVGVRFFRRALIRRNVRIRRRRGVFRRSLRCIAGLADGAERFQKILDRDVAGNPDAGPRLFRKLRKLRRAVAPAGAVSSSDRVSNVDTALS